MQQLPQAGDYYKHSKKGTLYRIVCIAKHSETLEDMVIYEAQYENELSKCWARPLSMFTDEVEIDGVKRPRFVPVKKNTI